MSKTSLETGYLLSCRLTKKPHSITKPPYILFWHKSTLSSMQVSIHLASGFRGICILCGSLLSPALVSDRATTRAKQMDHNGASSSV